MNLRFKSLFISAFFAAATVAVAQTPTAVSNDSRSEWRQKMDSGLDQVEKQINDLEAKSKKLSQKAQAELEGTIKDLKKSRDDLRQEIGKHSDKTKETAKDYYARLKAALNDLENGISAAKKKITKEK